MGKSRGGERDYRIGSSRNAGSLATFREQMADFVRAERLRELRAASHLSQERAAQEIGVSVKTIRSWEKGGKIKWPNAQKTAAFYGVDPESLVSRADPREPRQLDLTGEDSQLDRIEGMLAATLEQVGQVLEQLEVLELRSRLDDASGPPRRASA